MAKKKTVRKKTARKKTTRKRSAAAVASSLAEPLQPIVEDDVALICVPEALAEKIGEIGDHEAEKIVRECLKSVKALANLYGVKQVKIRPAPTESTQAQAQAASTTAWDKAC